MNLTTVARYEQYFGLTSAAAFDAMLATLIPRASAAVENFCNRGFAREAHASARLNGNGAPLLRFPDTPVLSVASLYLLNSQSPVAFNDDITGVGYQFDDQYLYLCGGARFPLGYRTVTCSYTSGFASSETAFVPAASGPYTITPTTSGFAATDRGVVRVDTGAALVLVGSSPAAGQYAFSAGVYTFAAANAGLQVTMSYDYVPGDVEQATIVLIGTALSQRQQLGINSKSLRDESISFDKAGFPTQVKDLLYSWRKVIPV